MPTAVIRVGTWKLSFGVRVCLCVAGWLTFEGTALSLGQLSQVLHSSPWLVGWPATEEDAEGTSMFF